MTSLAPHERLPEILVVPREPAPRKEGLARILGTSRDTEIGSEPSPFSCRELGKLALEPLARGRQAENLLCLLGNCNRFA